VVADFQDIGDWIIEDRRHNYDFVFWTLLVIGEAIGGYGGPALPVDVIYTLRNRVTGEKRSIQLPGDHKPEDLIAAAALPSDEAPGSEGRRETL
jgi:hypothetical protein